MTSNLKWEICSPPSGHPYVPPHLPYLDENGLSQRSLIEEMGPESATNNYMGPKPHNIFPSSSRRLFRVSPEIFTHNSSLRAFTERLLMESWFINGAQERQICEEEARLKNGASRQINFVCLRPKYSWCHTSNSLELFDLRSSRCFVPQWHTIASSQSEASSAAIL